MKRSIIIILSLMFSYLGYSQATVTSIDEPVRAIYADTTYYSTGGVVINDTGKINTTGIDTAFGKYIFSDFVHFDDTIQVPTTVHTSGAGLFFQNAANTTIVLKGGTSTNTTAFNMYYGVSSGRRATFTQRNTKYGLNLTASNPFDINELNSDADVLINGTEDNLIYTDASNGNVAIGSSVPYVKLDVIDSNNVFVTTKDSFDLSLSNMRIHTATANNWGSCLSFSTSSLLGTAGGAAIGFEKIGANNQGILHFAVKSTTSVESKIPIRMSLDGGGLTIKGSIKNNITTVNAATYDLLITDYILNVTYTTTGAVTSLTLPTAQVVAGRVIIIKDAGLNASTYNITIDTQGSETIDGAATWLINGDGDWLRLYCDGTNWFIVG